MSCLRLLAPFLQQLADLGVGRFQHFIRAMFPDHTAPSSSLVWWGGIVPPYRLNQLLAHSLFYFDWSTICLSLFHALPHLPCERRIIRLLRDSNLAIFCDDI